MVGLRTFTAEGSGSTSGRGTNAAKFKKKRKFLCNFFLSFKGKAAGLPGRLPMAPSLSASFPSKSKQEWEIKLCRSLSIT